MPLEAGFRIGEREVFPMEGRIAGPNGDLRVEPKAMAVLVELARHAPSVCTREQIVQTVWPRGYVSDDVLTRCIGQIRRALDDDPKAPALLETIPKRGYRLVSPAVERAPANGPDRAVAPRVESLIVLPFEHLSANGEDFVADGLTELLTLRLAALRGIRVISRTTAMQFKGVRSSIGELAARTGADWVIEGSVLQSGDRIQVVAQLIDARTDAHIWAADYVRDLPDLLSLQNEIARRVAAAIRLKLGATQEAPPSIASMQPPEVRRYLRGRHLISRRTVPNLQAALADFLAVTAAVPDHAPAWASAAECEMLLSHYGAPDQDRLLANCERHLDRALTLDPELGIGLSTRGGLRFFFKRDLAGATKDFEHALALLPSYSLAMVSLANLCAVRRDFGEAAAWMEQALLVDPLDVGVNMNVGDHHILRRRYADAVQALGIGLTISPGHRPSQFRLCWALALSGSPAPAWKLLSEIGPSGDHDAQWHEYAALAAAAVGDPGTAMRHFESLKAMDRVQRVPAWSMARAAAAAGLLDAALVQIQAAARDRSSSLPFLMVTPAFDALHADPRFPAIGIELGLPQG